MLNSKLQAFAPTEIGREREGGKVRQREVEGEGGQGIQRERGGGKGGGRGWRCRRERSRVHAGMREEQAARVGASRTCEGRFAAEGAVDPRSAAAAAWREGHRSGKDR